MSDLIKDLKVHLKSGKGTYAMRRDCGKAADRIEQLEAALKRLGDETENFENGDYPEEVSAAWMHECLAREKFAREALK
jgi:hypothetical protein